MSMILFIGDPPQWQPEMDRLTMIGYIDNYLMIMLIGSDYRQWWVTTGYDHWLSSTTGYWLTDPMAMTAPWGNDLQCKIGYRMTLWLWLNQSAPFRPRDHLLSRKIWAFIRPWDNPSWIHTPAGCHTSSGWKYKKKAIHFYLSFLASRDAHSLTYGGYPYLVDLA
jgi:hypothetical protein